LVCNGSNTNGEIIAGLSKSLSIFDGEKCLDEQINGTEANYMYENPDLCACKKEVKEYKSSIGTFGTSERVREIQEMIKKENVKLALKAHKSRLLEAQDFSFAIDNMQRKGQVGGLAMYRAKECASTKLWDKLNEIKKEGECQHLDERIQIYLGRESKSPLEDLKSEMIKYADAFNSNKKLSEDHLLPVRAFYSMQVSESVDMDTVIDQIRYRSVPLNNFTSSEAHVALSDFNLNMNGLEPSITNDEANAFMSARNGDLDILRRNPFLRMIIQEGKGDIIIDELNALKHEREELIDKLYSDRDIEIEKRGLSSLHPSDYPQDIKDNIAKDEENLKRIYDAKTQELITSEKMMKIALSAQDDRCNQVFKEENIEELFCRDLNASEDIVRSKIIPEVMKNLNPDEDIFDLFMANNDLFCNPFKKNEASRVYESLNVDMAFSSYLEDIANGDSEQFERFNNEIAPIVAKYTEAGKWTPENREKLIDELSVFLADNGTLDIREVRAIAGQGDEREAAIRAARELLTGSQETEASDYIDRDLALNLESLVNRPFDNTEVAVHEQDTASGIFRESELAEVGNASNYLLAANTEDVARARVVATEIETAEREGRPVNQEVITANTYVPRNTSTGEMLTDARTIVIPEPVTENKDLSAITPESSDTVTEEIPEPESKADLNNQAAPIVERAVAPSTQVETLEEQISTSSSTTTTTTVKAASPQNDRAQELRELMAEARSEEERLNRKLADLENGNSTNDEAGRAEADRLRSEIQTVRNQNRSYASQIPQSRTIASNNNTYRDSPKPQEFQNQFIEDQAVENFPIDEEDTENRSVKATGIDKTVKGQSSGKGASGKARPAKELVKSGAAGLINSGVIPGHEEAGIASCVYPQLVYQYPCFIPMAVFDEYNEVEFETDEKVILRKRNYPDRFVNNMGLEGRTFLVYTKYRVDKSKDRVKLLTYEWIPSEKVSFKDMRSPSFRSKKLSEILSNRWNPTFLRKKAKETRRVDKVYDLSFDEFITLTRKRDMRKLTEDDASSLLSNTTQLNLRVQTENKENFEKLKKAFNSNRRQ
jgi:hypothetical protein